MNVPNTYVLCAEKRHKAQKRHSRAHKAIRHCAVPIAVPLCDVPLCRFEK